MKNILKYIWLFFAILFCGCTENNNEQLDTYYIKYSIICDFYNHVDHPLKIRDTNGKIITIKQYPFNYQREYSYEIKVTNSNFQAYAETYGNYEHATELRIYVKKNNGDYFIVAHNNCKGTNNNPNPMIYVNYNLFEFD